MPLNGRHDAEVAEVIDAAYPVRMTLQIAVALRVILDAAQRGPATISQTEFQLRFERYGEGKGFEYLAVHSVMKLVRRTITSANWPVQIKTQHGFGWIVSIEPGWDWRTSRD